MSPYMGVPTSVPQHGLLGAAQSGFPLTSSLMGAISGAGGVGPFAQQAAGPTPDTQLALQLAGNPHAGPYSTAGNFVQPGAVNPSGIPGGSGGSTGSQIAGSLLGVLAKDPSLLKSGYNAVSGLLGADTLSPLGAEAASGTSAELGSAAAPALAADTAGALTPVIGSGATAAELGTTAGALAPISTAGGAASGAAAGGAAAGGTAGGGAATGAGLGAAAGGAVALGGALLPLALAALIPTGENAQWWQGMTDQINNPATSTQGKLTLANDLLNHPSDDPYTQAQLQAWGIPEIMKEISQPITTVAPGGKGWLGGGFTGASRA